MVKDGINTLASSHSAPQHLVCRVVQNLHSRITHRLACIFNSHTCAGIPFVISHYGVHDCFDH